MEEDEGWFTILTFTSGVLGRVRWQSIDEPFDLFALRRDERLQIFGCLLQIRQPISLEDLEIVAEIFYLVAEALQIDDRPDVAGGRRPKRGAKMH